MSSSTESTSKTSAGCETPTRYNFQSNNLDYLIDEIDEFLNEYTSDGSELPSNTNATESFEELNSELSEINVNDLKNETISKKNLSKELSSITPALTSEEIKYIYNVNKKNFPEPNDIKYVGENAAVFQLLEENEKYGIYEYIPNVNNWNVFYRPLPDDQQIQYVKKEPGTDYINNLPNMTFSQYPIIKHESESIEADNQNQSQPKMNYQQKNINQALQIQNFKQRNENPESSTKYKVHNNNSIKSDIKTSAGKRWNHNYKQNNYSDAGNIPPKIKNNKNNYKQSNGRYKSTHSKQNVFNNNFKRPFYKTPQENYSSFSAPTHRLNGFNSHSNRFHSNDLIQKPNKIFQGMNQFGPHMPFKRNTNEPNQYNRINDSQNKTISQYKSNINDKSFRNFQLPFVPPTNEVNEPHQDFSKHGLSLNQHNLYNGIQNQFPQNSTYGSKHEQNFYMKNNISVLPNWSGSYDHLNNNNMEMPKSGKNKPYNQYTTETNINTQNRGEKTSYNQYSSNNNFKIQNVCGKDLLNYSSTNQNIQNEKRDEFKPYNQYSTNNSTAITGKNVLSNRFSTNQSIEIKKRSECDKPSNYYPAKKNIEMKKSNNNETYNQNLINKNFKMQNRGKNELYNQYLNKKNIKMQKNGGNQSHNQNAIQKNIEKGENDEKSHLSLSTTNSSKKKIRIGIEEYKYHTNNKKNINMYKIMQVGPYNDYSAKENEEQKVMGVEPYNDYSINKKIRKCKKVAKMNHVIIFQIREISRQVITTLNNEILNGEFVHHLTTPNYETVEETVVTFVDSKGSLNHDGCKYTPLMSLQESNYLIRDYLSPESLVGCTIKLSSRKLANSEIRERLYTAFAVHGALLNSWWTSDDMFFVTYSERNVARGVYDMYPKNTSSSY